MYERSSLVRMRFLILTALLSTVYRYATMDVVYTFAGLHGSWKALPLAKILLASLPSHCPDFCVVDILYSQIGLFPTPYHHLFN
jgi:hypothetical protein